MTDIEIAKKIMEDENLSLVGVRDGDLIFKSEGRGIRPLYDLFKKDKDLLSKASVADRVVGRGAGLVYGLLNIKELYTGLLSEGGGQVLDESKIPYTYNKICPYILNNSQDDYCPIEKLSLDIKDGDELIEKLECFFAEKEGLNVQKK